MSEHCKAALSHVLHRQRHGVAAVICRQGRRMSCFPRHVDPSPNPCGHCGNKLPIWLFIKASPQITALPLKEHKMAYTVRASSSHLIIPFWLWMTTKDIQKKTCGAIHRTAFPVCFPWRLSCKPTAVWLTNSEFSYNPLIAKLAFAPNI